MSESKSDAGTADAEPTPSNPDGSKDSIEHFKSEAQKAFEARDSAKAELRELKQRLKALETERGDRDLDNAKKSGEIEQVNKAWADKLTTIEQERDQFKSRYEQKVIESQFHAVAEDKVIKLKTVLAQLAYEGVKLEVIEDDGAEKLVVKTPDKRIRYDVERWLDEYLEENPHLAKNPRKGGTGVSGPGSEKGRVGISIAELNRDPARARDVLMKDPEAAREILRGARLKG